MCSNFCARLLRTVASLRLSLLNPQNEHGNFRLHFLTRPGFFFFLLISLPFTLGWGNMKVHCTTAQSAKLYAFFFLTKTLSRNTNEFEILTSMLTSVSSVVLHNSGICPDVEWLTFFFLLVGRTRLSCMWACILLPANSSGSTHARRINKTIKETKLYLDKKFKSKKFDFYKLAV